MKITHHKTVLITGASRGLALARELKREEVRNSPAEVWKWVVDGKTYYYVPPYY